MTYNELEQKLLDTGLVTKSDYLTKYCELLINNRLEIYDSAKANYHHAVPRVYFEMHGLPVDNSSNNLFILLHKDHVLAHYYLAMAAKNDAFKYKMAYAVRFVIGQINAESKKNLLEQLPEVQRSYELVVKDFSENNPSKKPENAKKISLRRQGKFYIKKDGKSIVIKPEQLDDYLKDGWERGRVGKWASSKGRISIIVNGKNKMVYSAELQQYLDAGATVGQLPHVIKHKGNMGKMSAESRQRQAEKRRNKIAVHHKTSCIILYIDPKDLQGYLDNGYVVGTGVKSPGATGKIWVNKDGKQKYILPEQKDEYLSNGWAPGRK